MTRCIRCGAPAPAVESDAFSEWETTDGTDLICPDCVTGPETTTAAEDFGRFGDTVALDDTSDPRSDPV